MERRRMNGRDERMGMENAKVNNKGQEENGRKGRKTNVKRNLRILKKTRRPQKKKKFQSNKSK